MTTGLPVSGSVSRLPLSASACTRSVRSCNTTRSSTCPAAVANGSRQAAHESRRNQRRHRAKQRSAEWDRAHQHAARKRSAQQHAERKQQPAEKTGGDEQRQYRARQIAWRVHERQGRRHAQRQLARQPVKHGQRR